MKVAVKVDRELLVRRRSLQRAQQSLKELECRSAPEAALALARYNVAKHEAEIRLLPRRPAA